MGSHHSVLPSLALEEGYPALHAFFELIGGEWGVARLEVQVVDLLVLNYFGVRWDLELSLELVFWLVEYARAFLIGDSEPF